jgi:hypothetical protein
MGLSDAAGSIQLQTDGLEASQVNALRGSSVEVAVERLSDVLDDVFGAERVPTIDLWSVDLEGFEFQALHGVDWNRHRPRFVLIEEWRKDGSDVAINKFMRSKGYDTVNNVIEGDWTRTWSIDDFPATHKRADVLWRDTTCGEEVPSGIDKPFTSDSPGWRRAHK